MKPPSPRLPIDMLQAMNTGHEGSLSTCHANSPDDALRRLETMVLMGEVQLPLAAVRSQLEAALDLGGAGRPVPGRDPADSGRGRGRRGRRRIGEREPHPPGGRRQWADRPYERGRPMSLAALLALAVLAAGASARAASRLSRLGTVVGRLSDGAGAPAARPAARGHG